MENIIIILRHFLGIFLERWLLRTLLPVFIFPCLPAAWSKMPPSIRRTKARPCEEGVNTSAERNTSPWYTYCTSPCSCLVSALLGGDANPNWYLSWCYLTSELTKCILPTVGGGQGQCWVRKEFKIPHSSLKSLSVSSKTKRLKPWPESIMYLVRKTYLKQLEGHTFIPCSSVGIFSFLKWVPAGKKCPTSCERNIKMYSSNIASPESSSDTSSKTKKKGAYCTCYGRNLNACGQSDRLQTSCQLICKP